MGPRGTGQLVEPGLGSISHWRPEEPLTGDPVDQWRFVAAKR
ncbi:hypothetical protein [Streptomyces sp. NPDC057689]